MTKRALLAVVDDDVSVRESLQGLLRHVNFEVETFDSAEAFLASKNVESPACVILDVSMPGMSGPDLQRDLRRRGKKIPIIFITAQNDAFIRSCVLGEGAVDCLFKPFSEAALLEALGIALGRGQP